MTQKGDIETLTLFFQNNIVAELHLSRVYPFKEQRLIVYGTEGMLVLDDVQPWDKKLALYSYQGGKEFSLESPSYINLSPSSPLKNEIEHFLECIKEGREPLSPADQAHRIHRLLEQYI